MKAVDIPALKFSIPFADQAADPAFRNEIPVDSQIGVVDGRASLQTGFPPLNFTLKAAGGIPPFGSDENGILWMISAWTRWGNAGGAVPFDQDFSTAIGGYPEGAIVASATLAGLTWLCTADDNTSDPDAGGAGWMVSSRRRLTANTTFNVATTGSDTTGDGSSGLPWLTIQHAWDYLKANYDLAGFVATIQIADGTYSGGLVTNGPITGQSGPSSLASSVGSVIFRGNVVTPSSVAIAGGANSAMSANNGGDFSVLGVALGGANGIVAIRSAISAANVEFTGVPGNGVHIVSGASGWIQMTGNYAITGGAANHIKSTAAGAYIELTGLVVTLTGTPVFTNAFAAGLALGEVVATAITFSGAATGPRYLATQNGIIITGGGGANYFPGSVAGSTATGGQYS